MNNTLDKWLDSRTRSKLENKLVPYYGKYDFENYYEENDTDIRACDKINYNLIKMIQDDDLNEHDKELNNMEKYIDNILIRPNTNRYHTNQLFKMLIDYTIDNNFHYNIYNDVTNEYEIMSLIHPNFKNKFYKFCKDNS